MKRLKSISEFKKSTQKNLTKQEQSKLIGGSKQKDITVYPDKDATWD